MRRRSAGAILSASPTMVGAITVLIAIVAVFLAYNANSGLPFVPTYNISAELPDAVKLVPGNEVRIGGVRVGQITAIDAGDRTRRRASSTRARALKLDPDVEELPVDSTMIVRARSALGLKYLEMVRGDSSEGYAAGRGRAALGGAPGAGRHRRLPRHLRRADADGDPGEPGRVRQRPGRPRARPERRARRAARRARGARAGHGEPVRARDPARAVHRRDRRRRRRGRAGRRASRRRCSSTSTPRSPPSRASRRRSQETIAETPPTFAVADGDAADDPARSWRTARACSPSCARASSELAAAAPAIADALEAASPALRESPKLNRELAPTARVARSASTTTRPPARASPARADDGRVRAGDPASSGRRRPSATTGASSSATSRASPASARTAAASSGSRSSSRRRARTTRARSRPRPANGPTDTENFLHYNPYPNTAAPEPEPDRVRGGERAVPGRAAGDRERAGQPGHHHGGPAPLPDQAGRAMRLPWHARARAAGLIARASEPAIRGSGAAATAARTPRGGALGRGRPARDRLATSRTPRSCRGATRATR